MTTHENVSAVVLAAGKGTRMKSGKAKVLHELFFKPMLHHVLDAVAAAGVGQIAVVVGHQRRQVLDSLSGRRIVPVVQEEQLGTGHAALCAEQACRAAELVMILCGDTPLIRPETLQAMIRQHRETDAALTLTTTTLANPFGYGRIVDDGKGHVLRIVEEKDASEAQRAIQEINAGIYLAKADFLFSALRQVGSANSQGEVYLTDIAAIAAEAGCPANKFVHAPAIDVLGVNSRVELAQAHAELQMRRNLALMLGGVTLLTPESILVVPESVVGQDSVVQAGATISGRTEIGSGVLVEAGSVLHDCRIGDHAVIGAHSVLRGCFVAKGVRIPPLTSRTGEQA